jgi:LacI family transcriptional regulator
MIRGIDEAALESGYTVMVLQSNESYGRELANTKRLLESLVDGILVSVSSETKIFDHLQEILKRKLPMVQFDRSSSELKAPIVRVDNVSGGFQATEHLIQQGYRRIAILAGPKNLGIGKKRMKGFFDAHKGAKRKVDHDLITHCDFSQESGYWTTLDLLSMRKRPDAIFAISDRIAIGAMLAIREKGLQMPSDIGLVGFNNEPTVQLVTPAVSSVEMPSFELGKLACKLLIEKMQRHGVIPEDHEEILKTRLFIRPSSLRDPAGAGI